MNTLITICARAGSKGLPNKHLLPFCGKPLIVWSLIESDLFFKDIIVSSDSYKILSLAEDYEIDTRLRPKDLTLDETPKLDVLRDALNYTEVKNGKIYECLIDLDATNPCRIAADIKNCYSILKEKRPKTVVSVVEAKKNPQFNQISWCHEDSRYYTAIPVPTNDPVTRRQDVYRVYDVNANIYGYDTEWLRDENNLSPITDNTEIYIMPNWTRHDIDDEYDFFDCENNFRKYILNE